MSKKVYVLDTNIILQNMQNIYNLSDDGTNIIVVPETVLMELEDKKKLSNELGYQSRQFARLLAKTTVQEIDEKNNYRVVKLIDGNLELHIIAKDKYDSEMMQHNLAESNDKRIIETANTAKDYYKGSDVIFVSIDIYARTFALFENIETETLHDDKAEIPDFEFIKQINLESNHFNRLNYMNIKEIDKDYSPQNFSYEFISSDGNRAYAIISNDTIYIIDEASFNNVAIKPANLKQKFMLSAILSNMYNLVVIDAKAGSGKTLLSVASAMRLIDLGFYEKIVYVRNSIESLDKGADVGYLAGNDEKFRIYNMALYDTLDFLARKRLKKSDKQNNPESIQSKTEYFIQKYDIQMLWPGEARGRTINNAIVILDEWQNSSENTTQLILSRLDESCMGIVIGSNRQIDNLYLNKYNNGLTTLLKQTKYKHPELNMFGVELDKAVRGKFAEFSERIFEHKK